MLRSSSSRVEEKTRGAGFQRFSFLLSWLHFSCSFRVIFLRAKWNKRVAFIGDFSSSFSHSHAFNFFFKSGVCVKKPSIYTIFLSLTSYPLFLNSMLFVTIHRFSRVLSFLYVHTSAAVLFLPLCCCECFLSLLYLRPGSPIRFLFTGWP